MYHLDKMTSEEIANVLKENGMPIGEIINYDEKTDPNNLMGKTNEYIQKTDFSDTRLPDKQYGNQPLGGTIEKFNNEKDCQARYDYIDTIAHSGPLSMFMYKHGTVLVRLEKKLSNDDAAAYDAILIKLENREIEKSISK